MTEYFIFVTLNTIKYNMYNIYIAKMTRNDTNRKNILMFVRLVSPPSTSLKDCTVIGDEAFCISA